MVFNNINNVKQALKDKGVNHLELEASFKMSLELVLQDFRSEKEAKEIIARSEQNLTIDRKVKYPGDLAGGKGQSPINYWKKECQYCKCIFETDNRNRRFCYSSGHRQRYYKRKKAAEFYLEIISLLAKV